jgi:selenocysteine lyase/cysteine desulfurase
MEPSAPALDLTSVRARFPALRGDPPAFLDGPGGSQVPDEVIEAMAACLRDANANLGGPFATSVAATELLDRGRAAAADFAGSAPEEIAFGPNMTTLSRARSRPATRSSSPTSTTTRTSRPGCSWLRTTG